VLQVMRRHEDNISRTLGSRGLSVDMLEIYWPLVSSPKFLQGTIGAGFPGPEDDKPANVEAAYLISAFGRLLGGSVPCAESCRRVGRFVNYDRVDINVVVYGRWICM